MGKHGFAQNRSKLLAIVVANGEGPRKMLKHFANNRHSLPFKCSLSALSLGSIVTYDASSQAEI